MRCALPLCPLAALLCVPVASGQMTGRFYLEKQTFAQGEPVFLYFEASNPGGSPVETMTADPYSFCAGYQLRLSSDPSPTSSCAARVFGGSCLSGFRVLAPGATFSERLLVNYDHPITAPGDYVLEASRSLPYGPAGPPPLLWSKLETRETLRFTVDGNARYESRQFKPWLDRLQSADSAARREAARTLASLAPPSLEETLLDLVSNPDFANWAPLALHRLNSPPAMAALAHIVETTESGTIEHVQAANFLAQSGDAQWYPLLLSFALAHLADGFHLYPAAISGGDAAVAFLADLVRSGSEIERDTAISALGETGSRAAIPILLDLLRSSDAGSTGRALYSLRQLTHRTAGGAAASPQAQFAKWQAWWSRRGAGARIYKATECGEFLPLEAN